MFVGDHPQTLSVNNAHNDSLNNRFIGLLPSSKTPNPFDTRSLLSRLKRILSVIVVKQSEQQEKKQKIQ